MKSALTFPITVLIGVIFLVGLITVPSCNDGKGEEYFVGCTEVSFDSLSPSIQAYMMFGQNYNPTENLKVVYQDLTTYGKSLFNEAGYDSTECYKVTPSTHDQ